MIDNSIFNDKLRNSLPYENVKRHNESPACGLLSNNIERILDDVSQIDQPTFLPLKDYAVFQKVKVNVYLKTICIAL